MVTNPRPIFLNILRHCDPGSKIHMVEICRNQREFFAEHLEF